MHHPRVRSTVRRFLVAAAFLTLATAVGAYLFWPSTPKVIVRVVNELPYPLTDVDIAYKTLHRSAEMLDSGEELVWRIQAVDGSSSLVLSYKGDGGPQVFKSRGFRMGVQSRGVLYLNVGPNGVREVDLTQFDSSSAP